MTQPLDVIPVWAFFAGTVALVLGCIELGHWSGKRRNLWPEHEKEPPVGAMVAAVFALLAFILGFTFQLAASRFEARRRVVVEEANAVGTTYLRAGMLSEPERVRIRNLLREYVDVRLEGARTGHVDEAVRRSEELQARLWSEVERVGRADPHSEQVALLVRSLNDTIDIHGVRRFATQQNRLPPGVWVILFGMTALAMALVGFQLGLAGSRRSPAILILAATFAAVVYMIADLDRPLEGRFRTGQDALLNLRESMSPRSPPEQTTPPL